MKQITKSQVLNAFLLKEESIMNPDMPILDSYNIKSIDNNLFSVDLNGNGQCVDKYIVATLEQIGTMEGLDNLLYRDLTIDDLFNYEGTQYAVISYPTI